MLSPLQLLNLASPLATRANAPRSQHIHGRIDRFAASVLDKLGISDRHPDYLRLQTQRKTSSLRTCAWIDRRLLSFFRDRPFAMAIEIEGGLSTRFHRLSERIDWPRFAWTSVNTRDVDTVLRAVFPTIDNYTSLGCDDPLGEWHTRVSWRSPAEKIVIVGEQRALSDWASFINLNNTIQKSLNVESASCDLILCHTIGDFASRLNESKIHCRLLKEKSHSLKPSIMTRLRCVFSRRRLRVSTHCCHLRMEKS